MTQNFEAIHATNQHTFGTVSVEFVKFLDSLANVKSVENLEEI